VCFSPHHGLLMVSCKLFHDKFLTQYFHTSYFVAGLSTRILNDTANVNINKILVP